MLRVRYPSPKAEARNRGMKQIVGANPETLKMSLNGTGFLRTSRGLAATCEGRDHERADFCPDLESSAMVGCVGFACWGVAGDFGLLPLPDPAAPPLLII